MSDKMSQHTNRGCVSCCRASSYLREAGLFLVSFFIGSCFLGTTRAAENPGRFVFCCQPGNDLYQALGGEKSGFPRFETPARAVEDAMDGAGVLILADGYPEKTTVIAPGVFEQAAKKKVKLYVEYPASLPDLTVAPPKEAKLERGVVVSDIFGESLRPMRILMVNGCRYVHVSTDAPAAEKGTGTVAAKHPEDHSGKTCPSPFLPHLVLAKVAGVDTAVFGLKDTQTIPLLFDHPRGDLLVATSKLSHFVTGRYMPQDAWQAVWQTILKRLQPGAAVPVVAWTPTVRPTYTRDEPLPADVEAPALQRSAEWIARSRILRHAAWPKEALDRSLKYNTVRDMPAADWPLGDGSLGILEGYSSTIRADGSQPMRYAVRNDGMGEVAMLMALDAVARNRPEHGEIGAKILDYIFQASGLAAGNRADPKQPEYGLVGWALDSPNMYWGDDNARALLGMLASAALLKDHRWDDAVTRCILANFRTTGMRGFRPECLNAQALQGKGWKAFWDARYTHYSAHMQAWPWACYFWAYDQTRFEPFLERGEIGARLLMRAYPDRWAWVNRSGSIERARALLPLAWLVRVKDTPEHRAWLRRVAGDLIAQQDRYGAILETIGGGGHGTASNAEYGTCETSLIQTNGDPVADMLYTCNFALIGLHEAAAATGDPFYAQAEEKLAKFLCRIQVHSAAHPELDGAWYRAFNSRNWEYWASNADWEWGPWCTETGWTQPWIAGTLALRQMKTSLWDLAKKAAISKDFERLRREMLPDDALKTAEPLTIRHAAVGKPVKLTTPADKRYPGDGPESLTDGVLAGADYGDFAWMGFEGASLEATIDLGQPMTIHGLRAGFLQSTGMGIYVPSRVEFSVSDEGTTFRRVSVLACPPTDGKADAKTGKQAKREDADPAEGRTMLSTGKLDVRARYVRVRASNLGQIPAGKPGAGRNAWLFVDEIAVTSTDGAPER